MKISVDLLWGGGGTGERKVMELLWNNEGGGADKLVG
jgi:hypothetical protein